MYLKYESANFMKGILAAPLIVFFKTVLVSRSGHVGAN